MLYASIMVWSHCPPVPWSMVHSNPMVISSLMVTGDRPLKPQGTMSPHALIERVAPSGLETHVLQTLEYPQPPPPRMLVKQTFTVNKSSKILKLTLDCVIAVTKLCV